MFCAQSPLLKFTVVVFVIPSIPSIKVFSVLNITVGALFSYTITFLESDLPLYSYTTLYSPSTSVFTTSILFGSIVGSPSPVPLTDANISPSLLYLTYDTGSSSSFLSVSLSVPLYTYISSISPSPYSIFVGSSHDLSQYLSVFVLSYPSCKHTKHVWYEYLSLPSFTAST